MTTKRRTAKITQPSKRGYVAIRLDLPCTVLEITAPHAMHIDGVHGAWVDIGAGETFYAVRSQSLLEDNMFYIVTLHSTLFRCSCPASGDCKHIKIAANHWGKAVASSERTDAPLQGVADRDFLAAMQYSIL